MIFSKQAFYDHLSFLFQPAKRVFNSIIAERKGFEPLVPRSTTVFKTAAIDHSAISPCWSSTELRIFFAVLQPFFLFCCCFFCCRSFFRGSFSFSCFCFKCCLFLSYCFSFSFVFGCFFFKTFFVIFTCCIFTSN